MDRFWKWFCIILLGIMSIGAGTAVYSKLSELGDTTISSPTNGQVLTYASATSDWRNSAAAAGSGDLLADGTVPMTADWDIGNFDITLKALTGDGTIEGATLTEGGVAVHNNDEMDESSELLAIIDDETGTGLIVFNTAPTISGTLTWDGTSLLESGAAFQFGDATDATLTHTYANTGTDVTIAYSTAAMAVTGSLTATNLSGANTGDNTVATSGDAAVDFFGTGVDAVTDTTTCTDIEGTGLAITAGTLNWTAASTDLSDTGDLLYETELDAFSELDAQIADKALVNKADGAVWSGVHDYGGATSVEIPNSSGVTVDATGEIGLDTLTTYFAQGQLVAYGASAKVYMVGVSNNPTDNYVPTYDAGTDLVNWEASAGGAGAGDVSKVGTPVDNEIGVWTGDGTLEGDTNFQWNGSKISLNGNLELLGTGDIYSVNAFDIYTSGAADNILIDSNTGGVGNIALGVSGDADTLNIFGVTVSDSLITATDLTLTSNPGYIQTTTGALVFNPKATGFLFGIDGTTFARYYANVAAGNWIHYCITDVAGNQLILTNDANRVKEHAVPTQTNPTLVIQSDQDPEGAGAGEQLWLFHDQTDSKVASKSGDIWFEAEGGQFHYRDSDGDITEMLFYDSTPNIVSKWTYNGSAETIVLGHSPNTTARMSMDADGNVTFANNVVVTGTLSPIVNLELRPQQAKLPASNPAVIDASGSGWKLLFDDTTQETASWEFVLDDDYGAGTLYCDVYYTMLSGEANEVQWECYVMAYTPTTDTADWDTDSYDTENVGVNTVSATAGELYIQTITLTNDDSVAAGDIVRIKISTDSDDAVNDDATGDREFRYAIIRE